MQAILAAALVCSACALPQAGTPAASASGSPVYSPSTAIASATVSPNAPLPSFTAVTKQTTCDLELFCPGYGVLEPVQLSGIYSDSKTFVDKPAKRPTADILAAFKNLTSSGNYTAAEIASFVDDNFLGEGTDLLEGDLPDYTDTAPFIGNVTGSPYVKGFLQAVHNVWPKLARKNNNTAYCAGCTSTLLPLNQSFIIPGSRFRELYYWDEFFAMQGLLRSGLYNISAALLLDYFELVDLTRQRFGYGFVPNGARAYYLNRSQPPLLTQMLYLYTSYTNDTSLLQRGLAAIEEEARSWETRQTRNVTSASGQTYNVSFYIVNNTAPRPEGFVTDYSTAFGGMGEINPNFTTPQVDQLFANLATGAESGLDYSGARWTKQPLLNLTDNDYALRTLNIENIAPVDLNSIWYRNYVLLARMYNQTGNTTRASYWQQRAVTQRALVLDLMWNATSLVFNDFNVTSGRMSPNWTPASLAPIWSRILPDELSSNQTALQQIFAPVAYSLALYNSTLPASFLDTGLQWDFPSAWPPHTFFAIAALRSLPGNLTTDALSNFTIKATSQYSEAQFGIPASQLPGQPITNSQNRTMPANTSFTALSNVGNLTDGMGWRDGLMLALANRYMSGFYCSWYSTGGSIPGLLPQLPADQLNATNSNTNDTGHLFEKLDTSNLNAAGFGGEYTVQDGFAWSNGVAIYLSDFGANLTTPSCPPIVVQNSSTTGMRKRQFL